MSGSSLPWDAWSIGPSLNALPIRGIEDFRLENSSEPELRRYRQLESQISLGKRSEHKQAGDVAGATGCAQRSRWA